METLARKTTGRRQSMPVASVTGVPTNTEGVAPVIRPRRAGRPASAPVATPPKGGDGPESGLERRARGCVVAPLPALPRPGARTGDGPVPQVAPSRDGRKKTTVVPRKTRPFGASCVLKAVVGSEPPARAGPPTKNEFVAFGLQKGSVEGSTVPSRATPIPVAVPQDSAARLLPVTPRIALVKPAP